MGGLEEIAQQEGECVLVNQALWDVEVRSLEPATYAFFNVIAGGRAAWCEH